MATNYDETEARNLLEVASDTYLPQAEDRKAAAEKLMKQLLALSCSGISISTHGNDGIGFTAKSETVLIKRHGSSIYINDGRKPREFEDLKYNPSTKLFEGTQVDTFRPVAPGERPQKRSGLAVVVAHVLKELEKLHSDEDDDPDEDPRSGR